jgi:hypothetical protein
VAPLIVAVKGDIEAAAAITSFDLDEGEWTPPQIEVIQEPRP